MSGSSSRKKKPLQSLLIKSNIYGINVEILILGNGGALNDGLPYNSFLINKNSLIECPPDIMLSLQREKINYININEIYISHLHGDHSFGFPFLALTIFSKCYDKKMNKIKVYSPGNSQEYFLELSRKALSENHPCIQWIKNNFEFITINENKTISLSDYNLNFYLLNHFEETYGFVLKENGKSKFAYIADTKWCDNVEKIIKEKIKYIIIDLNGEEDDKAKIHLSEKTLVEKISNIKNIGLNTIFLGTHLKYQKQVSSDERVKYVYPGLIINI